MTAALIDRLEADESSRELDCEIALAIDGFVIDGERYGKPRYCRRWPESGEYVCPGQNGDDLVPRYTASLDAASALADRRTPGKFWWLVVRAMEAIKRDRLGAVASVGSAELARAVCVQILKERSR